ncbi:hypothetical protein [Sphingomonas nostoxanthinifaciens]|uniref:hypothetical protein n=1 Tax=Sphingomonas nostoxanthinifaciens TaxID=2872652 RepID=UPI001CC200D4|nr:hypothetical protein [Sphingomonas nostoxanthinifaciens]UAK25847.1 hypothetical protein K8P63_06910 [Sphingomonas nostoxanthinifaciens]
MAAIAHLTRPQRAMTLTHDDLPELDGLKLRIFNEIEPGFGVVPILGDDAGSHMLRQGEVAVYDETWHDRVGRGEAALTPGLYCFERQRPPSCTPNRMVADRFRDNDPVRMRCERNVVMVFPHPRQPEHWAYRDLRSRLYRGVRLSARTEGPIYEHGMFDMLLGPIVGIYQPAPLRDAH